MANLDKSAQVRVRDLICADQIALEKWGLVVDDVVPSADDVLKIKDALKKHDYREAILWTLQLCHSDFLVSVLRQRDLIVLADKIGAQRPASGNVWLDVDEVPHNFTGRVSELSTTHGRLSKFHSNQSIAANIVCIHGWAGCGKSTLARKYAFDNWQFYKGNVIWIDASSVESMRESFSRLATSKLGLHVRDDDDNQTLAGSVYDFFKHSKCLFIFDGLEQNENFAQFRPGSETLNPTGSTPYLLITSRKSEVAPVRENNVCLDIAKTEEVLSLMMERLDDLALAAAGSDVVQAQACADRALVWAWENLYSRIVEDNQHAARVAALLAYLNPEDISRGFVGRALRNGKPRIDFSIFGSSPWVLLQTYRVVQLDEERVVTHPALQAVIRSCLPKQQEADTLQVILEHLESSLAETALVAEAAARWGSAAHAASKAAARWGSAAEAAARWESAARWGSAAEAAESGWKMMKEHRGHLLHLLQLKLKSHKSANEELNFVRRIVDVACIKLNVNPLPVPQFVPVFLEEVEESLQARFGEEHEATIYARYKRAETYRWMRRYSTAFEVLEPLLSLAESALGTSHQITCDIVTLLRHVK